MEKEWKKERIRLRISTERNESPSLNQLQIPENVILCILVNAAENGSSHTINRDRRIAKQGWKRIVAMAWGSQLTTWKHLHIDIELATIYGWQEEEFTFIPLSMMLLTL